MSSKSTPMTGWRGHTEGADGASQHCVPCCVSNIVQRCRRNLRQNNIVQLCRRVEIPSASAEHLNQMPSIFPLWLRLSPTCPRLRCELEKKRIIMTRFCCEIICCCCCSNSDYQCLIAAEPLTDSSQRQGPQAQGGHGMDGTKTNGLTPRATCTVTDTEIHNYTIFIFSRHKGYFLPQIAN